MAVYTVMLLNNFIIKYNLQTIRFTNLTFAVWVLASVTIISVMTEDTPATPWSSFVPLCSLSSLLVTGGRWAALSHYSFPFLEFNINGNPLMCVLFCNCSTFPEYSVLFPLCIFILEEREKEWGRERKKCMCVYSASLVPLLSPSSSVHGQHSSFSIVILILILWFAFVEFPSLSLHSPSVPVRCPLLPFEPLAY